MDTFCICLSVCLYGTHINRFPHAFACLLAMEEESLVQLRKQTVLSSCYCFLKSRGRHT